MQWTADQCIHAFHEATAYLSLFTTAGTFKTLEALRWDDVKNSYWWTCLRPLFYFYPLHFVCALII